MRSLIATKMGRKKGERNKFSSARLIFISLFQLSNAILEAKSLPSFNAKHLNVFYLGNIKGPLLHLQMMQQQLQNQQLIQQH